jgi:biopolymer transport protein ExbD
MGMNVGSGGGTREPDVMIDINTTPLIDVMLVLLVTADHHHPHPAPFGQSRLPPATPPPLVKPEVVKIDIDNAGAVYWNGEVVADRATLEEKLTAAAAQSVQPELHLRPDKAAKYEIVAGVMASAQRIGLTKIGIVGSEQFIDE